MPDPWEPFDGARWIRDHYAEMDRLAERLRDPGREIRKMQADTQRQFEAMRDPLRGLRESYDQIRRRYGPGLAGIIRPPAPRLRVIEGGLDRKPQRGRPVGHISAQTKAAILAVTVYLSQTADPPSKVREAARAVADFANEHGLPDSELLDPDGRTLREVFETLLIARQLSASARRAAD